MRDTLEKVFDIIGEILAVVLVVVFLVFYLNNEYHFLDSIPVLYTIVKLCVNYGSLALVAVVGLEAMVKRNIALLILFLVVLAAVIVFMFFPGTLEQYLPQAPAEAAAVAAVL